MSNTRLRAEKAKLAEVKGKSSLEVPPAVEVQPTAEAHPAVEVRGAASSFNVFWKSTSLCKVLLFNLKPLPSYLHNKKNKYQIS